MRETEELLARADARTKRRIDKINRELARIQATTAPASDTAWPAEQARLVRVLQKRRRWLEKRRSLLQRMDAAKRGRVPFRHRRRPGLYKAIVWQQLKANYLMLAQRDPRNNLLALVSECFSRAKKELFANWMIATLHEINTATCPNGGRRFLYANEWEGRVYRFPNATWSAFEPVDDTDAAASMSVDMCFTNAEEVAPSDAMDALFTTQDCPVAIECMSALHICFLRAYQKVVGAQRFNDACVVRVEDASVPLVCIAPSEDGTVSGLREPLSVDHIEELQPGDWVYFYNHSNYVHRHANSSFATWRGVNAVYLGTIRGAPRFNTFEQGSVDWTESECSEFLLDQYNRNPRDQALARQYPKLTDVAQIPGLRCPDGDEQGRIFPVYRIRSELLREPV